MSGSSGTMSGSSSGTMHGSSSGTMSGSDGDLKGHASDQVLSGKVQKVSKRSLSIRSDQGERHTLVIVPETLITIDGQDGKVTDIKQGQEVRASYNELQGRNVAVKIEAGSSMGGTGSSGSTSGSSSGMSGSSSSGSSQGSGNMTGSSGTSGDATQSGKATSGSSGTGTTGSTESGWRGSDTSGTSGNAPPATSPSGTGK
jgi:hypothetical protein